MKTEEKLDKKIAKEIVKRTLKVLCLINDEDWEKLIEEKDERRDRDN